MGATVSSARDTNSFRLNFDKKSHQLHSFPLPSAITFEGIFQEHFFQTGCERTKDFSVNYK